jgi:Tfp pilus assembly protein PilO
MSAHSPRSTRWRDLDIAQMHLWPNAPRRWTLAFLAAVLLGLCVFAWIVPRYERLAQAKQAVLNSQNQILSAYQNTPSTLSDIAPVRQIKRSEENTWLTDLAQSARNHHLNATVLKPHELNETERNQLRELIQARIKNSPQSANQTYIQWSLDGVNQVGWIDISAQGTYSDVLAFVTELGGHDEWLALGGVEIKAISQNQVQWQGGFWYYKEAAHELK